VAKLKTHGSTKCKLFYKEDGSPIRRTIPKKRMSKKERLKIRKLDNLLLYGQADWKEK